MVAVLDYRLLERIDPAEIKRIRIRRSLSEFVRYMWDIVEPSTELVWSWYLDAICEHLEAVSYCLIKDLVINVPPRHLKSTITSVLWPCWEWLERPWTRWLTSSYALPLATRDSRRARTVMSSDRYRDLLEPDPQTGLVWTFSTDQNIKQRYENSLTGWRICTSVDAGATGEGGDIITVDDPHNVRQVGSEAERRAVHEWWDETMATRRNNPKTSRRVIIMQRSHEEDLSGHVMKRHGTELLCLPLEFEATHPSLSRTMLGFVDPRREEGELLCPQRVDEDTVASIKEDMGSYAYVGQMQQRPSPRGGGIFKEIYFARRWSTAPIDCDLYLQTWDLTFGTKSETAFKNRSYVAGYVLGFKGSRTYVLDEMHGRYSFSESLVMLGRLSDRWPQAITKLVEAKANGSALEDILRNDVPGIELVNPQGSKIARALAIESWAKSGGIVFPADDIAQWAQPALHELTNFPFGKTDDRVDAITQGVLYGMTKISSAHSLEERIKRLTG